MTPATPPAEPAGSPPAPWSGAEIAGAIFLVYILWPALATEALFGAGVYDRLYGPDLTALARRQGDDAAAGLALGAAGQAALAEQAKVVRVRLGLWAALLALPFQLVSVPLLFAYVSRTRPEQLGLTGRAAGRNALRGLLAWLVLIVPVLAVHEAVQRLYRLGFDIVPEEHPLERLAQHGLSPVEWALFLLAAAAAAPLLEELIFRGVLQPWLARRRGGGALAAALAGAVALAYRWTRLREALDHGPALVLEALAPPLFVVALAPGLLLVRRWGEGAAAVYGTSLLFAAAHTFAWPSPVPLFLLSLGLGTLALRSGSLVGPVVLHGLFNASSIALFVLT
jgi:membrane protease YdiL (CAAX protease family)